MAWNKIANLLKFQPMPLIKPHSIKLSKGINRRVEFKIMGHVKPSAKYLDINLMHDAPEWHSNSEWKMPCHYSK